MQAKRDDLLGVLASANVGLPISELREPQRSTRRGRRALIRARSEIPSRRANGVHLHCPCTCAFRQLRTGLSAAPAQPSSSPPRVCSRGSGPPFRSRRASDAAIDAYNSLTRLSGAGSRDDLVPPSPAPPPGSGGAATERGVSPWTRRQLASPPAPQPPSALRRWQSEQTPPPPDAAFCAPQQRPGNASSEPFESQHGVPAPPDGAPAVLADGEPRVPVVASTSLKGGTIESAAPRRLLFVAVPEPAAGEAPAAAASAAAAAAVAAEVERLQLAAAAAAPRPPESLQRPPLQREAAPTIAAHGSFEMISEYELKAGGEPSFFSDTDVASWFEGAAGESGADLDDGTSSDDSQEEGEFVDQLLAKFSDGATCAPAAPTRPAQSLINGSVCSCLAGRLSSTGFGASRPASSTSSQRRAGRPPHWRSTRLPLIANQLLPKAAAPETATSCLPPAGVRLAHRLANSAAPGG